MSDLVLNSIIKFSKLKFTYWCGKTTFTLPNKMGLSTVWLDGKTLQVSLLFAAVKTRFKLFEKEKNIGQVSDKNCKRYYVELLGR